VHQAILIIALTAFELLPPFLSLNLTRYSPLIKGKTAKLVLASTSLNSVESCHVPVPSVFDECLITVKSETLPPHELGTFQLN
jgi:hypothetical protein